MPDGRVVTATARSRAVLAGLTCATGAVAAHVTAGGEAAAGAVGVVVVVSALLAPLLLDRHVDPARTLALALVSQVVWHAAFVLTASPTGAMGHHVDPATMALHHLLAALLGALVAVGAERTLVGAVDWLVGVALPVVLRALAPTPAYRSEPPLGALAHVPHDAPHDPSRPLRAPPRLAPPR